jgi:hypothetical protein
VRPAAIADFEAATGHRDFWQFRIDGSDLPLFGLPALTTGC